MNSSFWRVCHMKEQKDKLVEVGGLGKVDATAFWKLMRRSSKDRMIQKKGRNIVGAMSSSRQTEKDRVYSREVASGSGSSSTVTEGKAKCGFRCQCVGRWERLWHFLLLLFSQWNRKLVINREWEGGEDVGNQRWSSNKIMAWSVGEWLDQWSATGLLGSYLGSAEVSDHEYKVISVSKFVLVPYHN